MSDTSLKNKRVAKNTLVLYVRTAITMIISLYSSRVILEQLGVSDYGIYNVVGGFVIMFNALAAPLGGATQRYITCAIGTNDIKHIRKVFSTSVYIHIIIAVITCVIISIVGVWYITSKMNLPQEREFATHFILYSSVLTLLFRIISVPYNSAIVAHEKFSFYAWNSITQSCLRLILILCLPLFGFDKLIFYCIIEMIINIVFYVSFIYYSLKKLYGCELVKSTDIAMYKEIVFFSGWNFLGTSSSIIYNQGSNLILNFFHGVTLNAAMGITHQVQSAVNTFVSNFTLAINPQITKSYASGDIDRSTSLIFMGSNIAAYMLLIVGTPIVLNIDYILNLWLVKVPEYVPQFVCLALLGSYLTSYTLGLNNLIFATGDIKNYQITCMLINVLSVILLYVLFFIEISPFAIFYLLIIQAIAKLFVLLCLVKKRTDFPAWDYLKNIYLKNFLFLIPLFLFFGIKYCTNVEMNFFLFVIESIFSALIMAIIIYFGGLNKELRKKFKNYIRIKIFNNRCTSIRL